MESSKTLISKIRACGAINTEILERIESIPVDAKVCKEWKYHVTFETSASSEVKNSEIESIPTFENVRSAISLWRYEGEKLEVPPDTFGDSLNYEICTFDDVKRLHRELLEVLNKYERLVDDEITRGELRIFLKNMGTLQGALGQIESLSLSLEGDIIDLEKKESGVELLSKAFNEMTVSTGSSAGVWSGVFTKSSGKKTPMPTMPTIDYPKDLIEWAGLTMQMQINLFDKNLYDIPYNIGVLTFLVEIDLSCNKFSSLPESFGNLTNLESLRLYGNKLSSLPESFGNLTNLKLLELDNNDFISTPEVLNRLTNLKHLELHNQKSGIKLTRPRALGESCVIEL